MIADPLTRVLSPPTLPLAKAKPPGFDFFYQSLATVNTPNQSVTTAKCQTPIKPFGTCTRPSPHIVTRPRLSFFDCRNQSRLGVSVHREESKSG